MYMGGVHLIWNLNFCELHRFVGIIRNLYFIVQTSYCPPISSFMYCDQSLNPTSD